MSSLAIVAEVREKCKNTIAKMPRDVFVLAVLILASFASFGLGYLTGLDVGRTGELSLEAISLATTTAESVPAQMGQVVASKSGTKYYLPNCVGADRIAETNKVWFVSSAAALRAGYAPAANCKGL